MRPSLPGSVVAFFLLAYAAAWLFFVPVALMSGPTLTPIGYVLVTLGAYSPSVVAIWLTRRHEGGGGVRRLVGRALRWGVAARWYVFALGYFAAIKLVAAVIHRVSVGTWPRFGTESLALIPVAIALSTPFQAGEEIGWRGYALPRLAARFGLGPASIVLGVIWANWHLPLFFVRGADTFGQSFFVYALQVTGISVAMAWLYARTRGSLLLVMLLHSAVNNSKDIVPSGIPGAANTFAFRASPIGWIALMLVWITGAYFLARMPRRLEVAT